MVYIVNGKEIPSLDHDSEVKTDSDLLSKYKLKFVPTFVDEKSSFSMRIPKRRPLLELGYDADKPKTE